MDISSKKSRADLRAYFKKNSTPTEANFADFIGSTLNQRDDGVMRPPGDPLSVEASTQTYKPALNFYEEFTDANPSWSISLASTSGGRGFAIGNAPKNLVGIDARIFIELATGNVGVGTVSPAQKLDVEGGVRAKSAQITGAAAVESTMDVSGALTAHSTLDVAGAASMAAGASVTGALSADSASVSGALSAGSASITTSLSAASAAVTTSLSAGSAAVSGSLTAASAAVSGALSVGSAAVVGALTADSAALQGALTAGSAALQGELTAQTATIKGPLQAASITAQSENATADLTLAGKGVNGGVRVSSPLAADSTLEITGKITAGGALDVTGAMTARSTLDVTGKISASSALDVAGALTANSTLKVAGAVTAASGVDVTSAPRSNPNDHPTGRPLYVTGAIKSNQGVEIRTLDATQGIGIGSSTIYAAGTNAVQDLILAPKGTLQSPAKARIEGALDVQGAVSATGALGGASVAVTGAISGGSAAVAGALTAGSAAVTGAISGAGVAVTGAISGASLAVTGALTSGSAAVSGALTAGTLKVGADSPLVSKIAETITSDASPVAIPTMAAVRSYVTGQASSSTFPSNSTEDQRYATVAAVKAFVNQAIPIGAILMWSGLIKDLPPSWALCDGAGGKTPDLRNKFILGAGSRAAGATGGSETVTLTEAQLPSHKHTGSVSTDGSHTHEIIGYKADFHHAGSATESCLDNDGDGLMNPPPNTRSAGDHSHTVTINTTGGGGAHDNMPPFYVLAFIMRVS